MSESFGPGVTRTLSAFARQFTAVVWQYDKPPLDSELNLMSQIDWDNLSNLVRSQAHSGFFLDPTRCLEDYETNPLWTNQFVLSPRSVVDAVGEAEPTLLACVNGWVFPVAGTDILAPGSPDDTANRIRLNPPPTTDNRTDFVFLEVWRTLVSPNPSTTNKPSAGYLWKYGNTQYGGTNIVDDLEDPSVMYETTKRVQLQYRIRVVGSGDALGTSVDLITYPDGLTDPQIRARGTAPTDTSFVFSNMRQELGDPSLWRAGDGDPTNSLGTIDGYVYAIPISAVFRRNAASFTAISFSGNPNQNGSVDRTPSSHFLPDPRSGARALLQARLTAALDPGVTGSVAITNLVGSGLEDTRLFPFPSSVRFLVVGEGIDEELICIDSVDPIGGTIFIDVNGRGRGGSGATTPIGTAGKRHPAGTPIRLYNTNPSGLYADEVARQDILDMRRSVTFGEWDYGQLLQHSLSSVVQNNLKTTFKKSGTGGDTTGVVTTEVSYLHSPLAIPVLPPNQVAPVDGPDGIRTVWSDSASVQRDTSVILDPTAPINNGFIDSFDTNLSQNWSVSADFQPHGFLNDLGASTGWTNGSTIFLHIGGSNGSNGARYGLQGGQKSVRFLAPYEAWLPNSDPTLGQQTPWRLRFLGGPSGNAATPSSVVANGYIAGKMTNPPGFGEDSGTFPGPMYPVRTTNFERPFIVLGDVVNSSFVFTGVPASSVNFINPAPGEPYEIRIPGMDWDTFVESAFPLGRSGRTLRDYLTDGGRDFTGVSSGLYLVVVGDTDSRDNNGAFQIIGAGTLAAQGDTPYTANIASDPSGLAVRPLSADFVSFFNSTKSVRIEIRAQEINAEGDNGLTNPSGIAVVLTDLAGFNGYPTVPGNLPLPWANTSPPLWDDGTRLIPIDSKIVLDMDLLWYPNRGASPRVPDQVSRFATLSTDTTLLRTVVSAIDPNFVTEGPFPTGERFFEATQIQLWNRVPSKGQWQMGSGVTLPTTFWGGAVVGSSEQDREAELFVDLGSKSVVFRPFAVRNMTLKGFTTIPTDPGVTSLIGSLTYTSGAPVDGAGIFTPTVLMGYTVPLEFMPRFGRQDIPYHLSTGPTDPVLPGINHLFQDQPTLNDTSSVFWIVGGENNSTSGSLVSPMLFATSGSGIPYCLRGTLGGALHPAYGARKQTYTDVVSSDLGVGMNGIELPPYHGIARLYGVYEYNDFMSHLSGTYPGAFQGDRVTPIGSPPRNLLRVSADKQTLFIRKGGGQDVTGSDKSHTYLVPESAIDISNIPGFVDGQVFSDFDFVVECVVFGFARGFIDENNFLLARRKSGGGDPITEGDNPELTQTAMVLPCAMPKGSALYEVYSRTVYQGDPYMTRSGATVQPGDYVSRYGQIPQSSAVQIGTPIQQFNTTTGVMTVTRPNPRALQVLATMDFFTTLGTGKMGGQMWPGTPLDCGYTDPAAGAEGRIPSSALDLPWRILPRAFTEGQNRNPSTASLLLTFKDYASAITYHFTVTVENPGGVPYTISAPGGFTGVSNATMATSLAGKINEAGNLPVTAIANGASVLFRAKTPGSVGNAIRVTTTLRPNLAPSAPGPYPGAITSIAEIQLPGGLLVPVAATHSVGSSTTGSNLFGGLDLPVNAGDGNSMVSLTGVTERLPLGILASDSDFISENILGDRSSSLQSFPGGVRAVYEDLPLTGNGQEFTRFVNDPGSLLALSDGGILAYIPYTDATPSGSTSFRLYRGGGAVFVLSGTAPGGPVSWVSDGFAASLKPVLKGAALACKALLVRNYHEEAFALASERSEGDEIQMVILTYAVYGTPTSTSDGVTLSGVISPTGYGEGYASADRYLIPGRPMDRGRTRNTPNPGLQPAPLF